MATFKSEFQDLATELISDEFADFRVQFRVFKESDAYDPRTGKTGASESHDLQAIPLEIEDAQRVFANATNDNIYLVALKAGSSQEFDTSYTAEYDGFLYSIERVIDDPADAAYLFSLVGGSKQEAPQPTTRFAPNFNGISQYASSGEIVLIGDFTIESTVKTTQTTDFAICDGSKFNSLSTYALIYIDNPDGLQFLIKNPVSGFDRYIFGGWNQIIDGQLNNVRLERTGSVLSAYVNSVQIGNGVNIDVGTITLEGLWFGGSSRFMSGIGCNVKINNGSIYSFPMDDGWQNNPVMRNTGGGANGTYINMTEAAWQEIPL